MLTSTTITFNINSIHSHISAYSDFNLKLKEILFDHWKTHSHSCHESRQGSIATADNDNTVTYAVHEVEEIGLNSGDGRDWVQRRAHSLDSGDGRDWVQR